MRATAAWIFGNPELSRIPDIAFGTLCAARYSCAPNIALPRAPDLRGRQPDVVVPVLEDMHFYEGITARTLPNSSKDAGGAPSRTYAFSTTPQTGLPGAMAAMGCWLEHVRSCGHGGSWGRWASAARFVEPAGASARVSRGVGVEPDSRLGLQRCRCFHVC